MKNVCPGLALMADVTCHAMTTYESPDTMSEMIGLSGSDKSTSNTYGIMNVFLVFRYLYFLISYGKLAPSVFECMFHVFIAFARLTD